ncbi:unnamed protein product [Bemisia tabaci]|uniref:Trimethyllysine dioxygenase, mitochondrial n=1 Tax=Bemisia tabaci TaxID=7038 RepID=A0A9P0A2T6_BEMTA|nr:unnamed protein product [Bemisia tabaci]
MTEDSMNMTVKLDGVGESLEFSAVWLRDNCRCKDCYNYATKQRSIDVTLLSPFCFACHYFFENEKLHLTWGDGHKSTFDIAFLRQYSQLEQWPQPFLWKGEEAKSLVTAISLGKFNQLEGQEEVANSILRNGLAIVSGVEPTLSATQNVIERLAPIYHTLFGGMWEVGDSLEHRDTAYTKAAIGPHTDNTYFLYPAGLQVFHCLRHVGEGGETTLVDGFHAAMELKSTDPQSYATLAGTHVEAEYLEPARHHRATGPILRHRAGTTELEQIRFNCYDRSPRLPANANAFYSALRKLAAILRGADNEWKFKLEPGNVVFINNWRVLHGRASFSGTRNMVGAYVSMGEFLSRARVLKLIR